MRMRFSLIVTLLICSSFTNEATLPRPPVLDLPIPLHRSRPLYGDSSTRAGAAGLTSLYLVLTICGQKNEGGLIEFKLKDTNWNKIIAR